jgi:hypothetical protein
MPGNESKSADGKVIFLGACLIAAVRLAREDLSKNSPAVLTKIHESVHLANRPYEKIKRDFPHYFSPS